MNWVYRLELRANYNKNVKHKVDNQSDIQQLQFAQRERLAFIDYCLQFVGKVSRTTLVEHFNVGLASCSRDFKIYHSLAPHNLTLKHQDKYYYRTEQFTPVFTHDPHAVLSSLVHGFGDGLSTPKTTADWVFDTPNLTAPEPGNIAQLTRAIVAKHPLKLTYQSLSSGRSTRVIIPHAIVNNGQRWHVRAYDRKTSSFRDFVCNRIELLETDDSSIAEHEMKMADDAWQTKVELLLIPHPSLKYKKPVEFDYNMTNGHRIVEIRAALAGYLLRYWNVDCSDKATLNASDHHLWLKSQGIKSQITNINLAPGVAGSETNTESMEQ